MTYGNGVRDDSQQLRDIQDLIAKLKDVNRQLELPIRTVAMPPADAVSIEAVTIEAVTINPAVLETAVAEVPTA
jgi:hypothetical protein